jgi:hypothetical protein
MRMALIWAIAACSSSQGQQTKNDTTADPQASARPQANNKPSAMKYKIVKYTTNAAQDHYDDGSFAVSHATELEILEGDGPKSITIYHSADQDTPAYWQQPGVVLRFSVDVDTLKMDMIFRDALKDVEVIRAEE